MDKVKIIWDVLTCKESQEKGLKVFHRGYIAGMYDGASEESEYWQNEAMRLRRALEDSIVCFGDNDVLVSHERIEAWHNALKPRRHPKTTGGA